MTESTQFRIPVHRKAVEGLKPDALLHIRYDDFLGESLRVHQIHETTDPDVVVLDVGKIDVLTLTEDDLAVKIPKRRVAPDNPQGDTP